MFGNSEQVGSFLFLTGPKSQNYGAAVDATHAKKAKLLGDIMTRDFLKNLGLEDSVIDKVLDENMQDIGKEKSKTTTAQTELAGAREKLQTTQTELETLKSSNGDIAAVQKQLSDLQAKYDTETEQYKTQIADRDYFDAVTHAIAEKNIKFSSKAAEKAYISDLKANRLELKDGTLVGFDDYHKAQLEADPSAFQSDKPAPTFVKPVGTGGKPALSEPENVTMAKAMGAAKAATLKASNDVFNHYT